LASLAYNAALGVGAPMLGAYLAWRVVQGKSRVGWPERWGRLPATLRPRSRPSVWFHAASVGEVSAARPIIRALQEANPSADCVMTVITPGGHEVAEAMVGDLLRGVAYLPFDLVPPVRRAIRVLDPDLFVGVETEIWPNLLQAVARHGARSALVNARLSDRSWPRYRRARGLMRWALSPYDRIMAQSEEDARRFVSIGASEAVVSVGGNVKFDEADRPLPSADVECLRRDLGISAEARVLVVGSTRVVEEERLIRDAFRRILESAPGVVALASRRQPATVMIHAPRHVERADAIEAAWRGSGFRTARRTSHAPADASPQVIILDTFGELGRVYAVGDVAFVGNSLVPPGGGQNLLQPLAQGKPVLFGPHMSNFRDAVAMAMAEGVGRRVSGADELAKVVCGLLEHPTERAAIRERALALVNRNRGAARRYADALSALAESGPGEAAAPASRRQPRGEARWP